MEMLVLWREENWRTRRKTLGKKSLIELVGSLHTVYLLSLTLISQVAETGMKIARDFLATNQILKYHFF